MENNIINFFAETPSVKGYLRSIVYDLPRREYFFIPNSLYEIILKYNKKPISLIYQEYAEATDIIDEYLNLLKEKETYFISTEVESKFFPKLNLQWDYPAKISNSFIEISTSNYLEIDNIINQLIKTGCRHFQVYTSEPFPIEFWDTFLEGIKLTPIKLIDIFTKMGNDTDLRNLRILLNQHPRLKLFFLFDASKEGFVEKAKDDSNGSIYQTRQSISPISSCGKIDYNYFNVNIELFTESQHFNTCLNRKVCIDANGEIKNCPSMSRSFGNIKDTTLAEAIEKPGFRDLWGIRKDDIDVCKDCEFRHMCTDCRAFIKDPENIYSQPAKCPYNPFIAKWEGEEGYITVEQWRLLNPNWEKKVKRYPLTRNPQPVV